MQGKASLVSWIQRRLARADEHNQRVMDEARRTGSPSEREMTDQLRRAAVGVATGIASVRLGAIAWELSLPWPLRLAIWSAGIALVVGLLAALDRRRKRKQPPLITSDLLAEAESSRPAGTQRHPEQGSHVSHGLP